MPSTAQLAFDAVARLTGDEITDFTKPSSYSGLYGFHKYWGKKPVEPLRALISILSDQHDIVADPFLGSGAIAKETADLNRRFLGSEINPIAIRLAEFNANPCSKVDYETALLKLADLVREQIVSSYVVNEFGETSHLLWQNGVIETVWQRPESGVRKRIERPATEADYLCANIYGEYNTKYLRKLTVFKNSRINATAELSWQDLFCGRALRNIDLLIHAIRSFPIEVRRALELTLTASVGQMSRMVFAITSRGKMNGTATGKIEVGSWVIGFWRPKQHFEINVWNCFEARAKKLLKALPEKPTGIAVAASISEVVDGQASLFIGANGASEFLACVPENSLQLVITDPPHGDRIPYLELSEIWNAVLGVQPNLENEVVVSNARERGMTLAEYNVRLTAILRTTAAKVKDGGFIVLLFNSRHQREWQALDALGQAAGVTLTGSMPLNYSARSVVQDNREGSMKTDYIVIYSKGSARADRIQKLESIPGWISQIPLEGVQDDFDV